MSILSTRLPHGLPAAQNSRIHPYCTCGCIDALKSTSWALGRPKQWQRNEHLFWDAPWIMTISAKPRHTPSVELLRCGGTAVRALWVLSRVQTLVTCPVEHRQQTHIAKSYLARCSTSPWGKNRVGFCSEIYISFFFGRRTGRAAGLLRRSTM